MFALIYHAISMAGHVDLLNSQRRNLREALVRDKHIYPQPREQGSKTQPAPPERPAGIDQYAPRISGKHYQSPEKST